MNIKISMQTFRSLPLYPLVILPSSLKSIPSMFSLDNNLFKISSLLSRVGRPIIILFEATWYISE